MQRRFFRSSAESSWNQRAVCLSHSLTPIRLLTSEFHTKLEYTELGRRLVARSRWGNKRGPQFRKICELIVSNLKCFHSLSLSYKITKNDFKPVLDALVRLHMIRCSNRNRFVSIQHSSKSYFLPLNSKNHEYERFDRFRKLFPLLQNILTQQHILDQTVNKLQK